MSEFETDIYCSMETNAELQNTREELPRFREPDAAFDVRMSAPEGQIGLVTREI